MFLFGVSVRKSLVTWKARNVGNFDLICIFVGPSLDLLVDDKDFV